MTFKQLLQKVSFNDLIPHISCLDPFGAKFIPSYKETYDILHHTDAAETDNQIRFYREPEDGQESSICIDLYEDDFESDYWPTNLGKEIVPDEGVALSDEELAAHCLFHITAYGFSPEAIARTLQRQPAQQNSFEERADKLWEKKWANYTRIKTKKADLTFDNQLKEIERYDKRKKRRNRLKRMRDHRQERRIAQLEHMGLAERAITWILATARDVSREQVAYLFKARRMEEQELHSRSYDRTRRMDYLWELLTKYTPSDERPYTHTIAILSTAPDWPLTVSERQSFEHIVAKFSEKTEIVSAVGTMADLGEEAELFILKSY